MKTLECLDPGQFAYEHSLGTDDALNTITHLKTLKTVDKTVRNRLNWLKSS